MAEGWLPRAAAGPARVAVRCRRAARDKHRDVHTVHVRAQRRMGVCGGGGGGDARQPARYTPPPPRSLASPLRHLSNPWHTRLCAYDVPPGIAGVGPAEAVPAVVWERAHARACACAQDKKTPQLKDLPHSKAAERGQGGGQRTCKGCGCKWDHGLHAWVPGGPGRGEVRLDVTGCGRRWVMMPDPPLPHTHTQK